MVCELSPISVEGLNPHSLLYMNYALTMTLFSCKKLYSAVTTYILLTLYIQIFMLAVVLRLTPANVLLWAGHMVGFVLCGENHLAPLSP